MVENRPWLNFFTHFILILGIVAVVFPVYIAFVASTQTAVEVEAAPMSLLPGTHMLENYAQILLEGGGTAWAWPWGSLWVRSLFRFFPRLPLCTSSSLVVRSASG